MTIQKLLFKPGINRDNTSLANKGGWFEGDKVRFRSGTPEKIGGWTRDFTVTEESLKPPSSGSFWGVGRWLFSWQTLFGTTLTAIGTNSKLYVQAGTAGIISDVTPLRFTTRAGVVTFTANTVGLTAIVTVNCTTHGCGVGDFVSFTGAVSLGGAITATILNAEFVVTSAPTANTFTINVGVNATASDTGTGGTLAIGYFQVPSGPETSSPISGWGANAWGDGSWGNTASTNAGSDALVWSGGNYGEYLIANPRYEGLYVVKPDTNTGTITTRATLLTQQPFTITSANPGVITLTEGVLENTGFVASTNGTLPTNLVAGTTYYLVNVVGLTANFATTFGGTPISTTAGTQTGVHALTIADCPTSCGSVVISDNSRFVLAFGVNDYGSNTRDPMLVRWSDQENLNLWTPAITNQAGSFRLSRGSEIITAQQTRQEVLVWTDSALYSMQYLGPPFIWGFNIMGDNLSIASPNAAVTANNITYWMGVDKFYIYSGRVESLPCTLRQYVFGDLNLLQRTQFFAGTNEGFHEIWWFYCSSGSTTIDRYVIYNYLEGLWTYGNLSRTAWLDSPFLAAPVALNYDGQILYHEDGADDGSTNPPQPLAAYIQSADFDIGDGDHYAFVDTMIPDVCFDGSTAAAPQVTLTVKPRQNPGAAYNAAASNPDTVSVNDYSAQHNYLVQQFTEYVYVRVRGRQMAFKIESDTLGAQWQLGATRINIRPDGRRR